MKRLRILTFVAALISGAILAAFSSGLFAIQQLAAQSPPLTLVKAGRLLDPETGNALSPAAVLIDGGKIKEVGAIPLT